MDTISSVLDQLRAQYLAHYWYHGLAWLALWYLVIVWPLAAGTARLWAALNKRRSSWEQAAYAGWSFGFAVHIALWVFLGLDSLPLTWHWGAPGELGFRSPNSGLEYLVATMSIVPYLFMFILDLWLCFRLAHRASQSAA